MTTRRNIPGILALAFSLMMVAGVRAEQDHRPPIDAASGTATTGTAPHAPLWIDPATGFPNVLQLPLLRRGVQTHQFCSYDRSGDNYDHEYFPLYMDRNGECVIFDAYGPGCLYRHHMNLWMLGKWKGDHATGTLDGVRIRYYFDDEPKARIDMDVSTFFSDKNPLGIFRAPLGDNGGDFYRLLYHPMFFRKRLKVALSEEPGGPGSDQVPWSGPAGNHPRRRSHWYQYTYHTYTDAPPGMDSWSKPPDLSGVREQLARCGIESTPTAGAPAQRHAGEVTIEPGASQTLFHAEGGGAIHSIQLWLTPLTRETLDGVWLKIYWDGQQTPCVAAPLGAFFLAHPDRLDATCASLLFGYSRHGGMYAYFPMPYWKSARVLAENTSTTRVESLRFEFLNDPSATARYPQGTAGYFHAVHQRAFPRTEGPDFTYLSAAGSGHVVAHSAVRWDTSMEENERTYFDGSLTPQIQGDGFEDDQGFGWGLKERSCPIYGAPVAQGGSGALYRLFFPDLYVFESSVRHGHQVYGPHQPRGHGGHYHIGNETSTTYFYALDEPRLFQTDEIDVGGAAAEAAHEYAADGPVTRVSGDWWYDGDRNNVLFAVPSIADDGQSFSGSTSFTVKIDPANRGVRLRRRTDKANNRQLAKVYVDGKLVSERPWYTVDFEKVYRGIRWADTDFEIPEQYTRGKQSARIRIEHVSSQRGCIDAFRYWVFCYRAPTHRDGP
jgi:Protein of unknown function (DUF2961)